MALSYYEGYTWPLLAPTHCYTTKSRDGLSWATQTHRCWIATPHHEFRSRRIPFTSTRYICVGYDSASFWDAFSLFRIDNKHADGVATGSAPRSHSLLVSRPPSVELSVAAEHSTSSLPVDLITAAAESPNTNTTGNDGDNMEAAARTTGSQRPNETTNAMVLLVRRGEDTVSGADTPDDGVLSMRKTYTTTLQMRPTALHLVVGVDQETSSLPRLWWGSADNCLLHRMEPTEECENHSNELGLTITFTTTFESSVVALDGHDDMLLVVGCQDGCVALLKEQSGEVLHKIVVDGPIVALQHHAGRVVLGSLCGYAAQMMGNEPPELLLQGLEVAGGGEDSVLAVHLEGEICWIGTHSGRCLACTDSQIVWSCQLPYAVHGISTYRDGVLVITKRSVHWLRSVDAAVGRAQSRLRQLRAEVVERT